MTRQAARITPSIGRAIGSAIDAIREGAALQETEIATLLQTSSQTLWRWKRGARPQPESRDRLLDLKWIVEKLSAVYEPEDAYIWLHSRHPRLAGDRPVERIREGQLDEVLDLVDQLSTGAYV